MSDALASYLVIAGSTSGGIPMRPETSVLVMLVRLIDRLPLPPDASGANDRFYQVIRIGSNQKGSTTFTRPAYTLDPVGNRTQLTEVLPPLATADASAIQADQPVGYWRLGERGGTTYADLAGGTPRPRRAA